MFIRINIRFIIFLEWPSSYITWCHLLWSWRLLQTTFGRPLCVCNTWNRQATATFYWLRRRYEFWSTRQKSSFPVSTIHDRSPQMSQLWGCHN